MLSEFFGVPKHAKTLVPQGFGGFWGFKTCKKTLVFPMLLEVLEAPNLQQTLAFSWFSYLPHQTYSPLQTDPGGISGGAISMTLIN